MFMLGSFGDGSFRIIGSSGLLQGSFAIGPGGNLMSAADSLKSECGRDFDEYVRRALSEPFPYSSTSPASRTIDNLWNGRRLRIYSGENHSRQGKVVSWTQWNTGPMCRFTFWNLHVQMDSLGIGDAVVVNGLRGKEKQYNGKKGRIVEHVETKNQYKIKLDDEKGDSDEEEESDSDDEESKNEASSSGEKEDVVLVVNANKVQTSETTYCVNRMNIDGGGTLTPHGESSSPGRLISLEWLEPASPAIDLDEGSLKANCPTCRAVEPPLAAYDDSPPEKQEDCPICMENKTCRTLSCDHQVCHDCWNKWRNATSGIPITPPELDADQLQKEREDNFQELKALLPHTLGGTGSKPGDSEEVIDQAHETFGERSDEILRALVENAESGEEGLAQFWKSLLSCSIHLLCIDQTAQFLINELPVPALEVMFRVFQERSDEIYTGFQRTIGKSGPNRQQSLGYVEIICCDCCNRIGELHEHVENYRGAIPWYERSLVHAKKRQEFDRRREKQLACKQAVGSQYCNLGLAQKRAGMLSLALENYDASLQVFGQGCAVGNRQTLLREMKEWTGTSGKLTPGC